MNFVKLPQNYIRVAERSLESESSNSKSGARPGTDFSAVSDLLRNFKS